MVIFLKLKMTMTMTIILISNEVSIMKGIDYTLGSCLVIYENMGEEPFLFYKWFDDGKKDEIAN